MGLEKVQNLRLGAVREERGNENVCKITDSLKLVPNMYDSLTSSIAIMNTPWPWAKTKVHVGFVFAKETC